MNVRKIKFEQYRVRGKHGDFDVLVVPNNKHMWAYYEHFDERYEIDGDIIAYQSVKYALAALVAAPNKLIYFPIRKSGNNGYYAQNYDAALLRPGLQFRRSEWVKLRRQLDKAHKIENFALWYDPEYLCRSGAELQKDKVYYEAIQQRRFEINTLVGDTGFLSPQKETCLGWLASIISVEHQKRLSDPGEMIGVERSYYLGNSSTLVVGVI